MSFTGLFLLGTVFFRTAIPCSGGITWKVEGYCKKGATAEYQGAYVKYVG